MSDRDGAGEDLAKKLWARVEKELGPSGCWFWNGPVNLGGYGLINHKKKTYLTHRLAYSILRGPIKDGYVLDHKCRYRACLNPQHLEPVTPQENRRRGTYGRPWRKKLFKF